MLDIQPLNGYVVLRPCEPDEKSKGGIYLPQTTDQSQTSLQGMVEGLSLGYSSKVSLGDRVLYKRGVGQHVEVDGAPRILVREDDLIAKLFEVQQRPCLAVASQ